MVDWAVKPVSFFPSFLSSSPSVALCLKSLVNSVLVQQITVEEICSIKCDKRAVTQTLFTIKG